MPSATIKKMAKKSGKSIEEVERLWDKAMDIAKKKGLQDPAILIPYAMGVLKKMVSVKEAYDDLNSSYKIRSEPKNSSSIIFKRDQYLRKRNEKDKKRKKSFKKVDEALVEMEVALLEGSQYEFRVNNNKLEYKFSGKWVGGPKAFLLFRKQFNIPAAVDKNTILQKAKKMTR